MRLLKRITSKFNNQFIGSRPFLVAAVSVLLCACIAFSSAYFISNDSQKLNLSASGITSETTNGTVKNTSGKNAYVRAYLVPYWKTIATGEEYVGVTEWDITEKLNNGTLRLNDAEWTKLGNYYYYKNALTPGETSSSLVTHFDSDDLSERLRNTNYNPKIELPNQYSQEGNEGKGYKNTANSTYAYPMLTTFTHNLRQEAQVEVDYNSDHTPETAAATFESGSGTEADPYIIVNAKQLLKCVISSGVADNGAQLYYKLGADIFLNTAEAPNENHWVYSRDIKSRFCGVFDGNGYTVNRLFTNPDGLSDKPEYFVNSKDNTGGKIISGLFPCLGPGAVVKNLGVVDPHVWDIQYGAVIAGYACALSEYDDPIKIENCYVQNARTSAKEEAGNYYGGIVGYANLASASNGDKLLEINNTYFYGEFDCWGINSSNGTVSSYATDAIHKNRYAVIGGTSTPASVSINNGYSYFYMEDTQTGINNSSWQDDVKVAPENVAVTDYFSHQIMSNLVDSTNRTNVQKLADVSYGTNQGKVWKFCTIDDVNTINGEIFPQDGLLLSVNGQSDRIAEQAYKIAYELIQAEGTINNGATSAAADAWGEEAADLVRDTSVENLRAKYDFHLAFGKAAYNHYETFWNVAGTGDQLQPVLVDDTLRKRMTANNVSNSYRIQTIYELMSGEINLDKKYTPSMAFSVYAPIGGTYEIAPEFISNDSLDTFSLICVNDDKYYRCNFSNMEVEGKYGHFSTNIMRVNLKEGINTVRVILTKDYFSYINSLPENNDSDNTNDIWVNFNGLWVEKGLTVYPAVKTEVDLYDRQYDTGEYEEDGTTKIMGRANAKTNNYGDKHDQDCINTGQAYNANAKLITHESLNDNNFENVPYSLFVIDADIAGYYDMELKFDTKASDDTITEGETSVNITEGYIVVRVNGVNYKKHFKAYGKNQYGGSYDTPLNISVPLKKGTNYITITAPLDINTSESGWNYNYISWFNQFYVNFYRAVIADPDASRALTSVSANDKDDDTVVANHPSILEAEIYAYANRYTQVESAGNATVLGGMSPWYSAQPDWDSMPTTGVARSSALPASGDDPYYLDSNISAHIDYHIYAPETRDDYYVRPRLYFSFNDNNPFDANSGKNYFIIMVNEKLFRVLYNDNGNNTLTEDRQQRWWFDSPIKVALNKGVNVIRIIPIDRNTTIGDSSYTDGRTQGVEWVNHDYLELLSDRLVGVKPENAYKGALDANYIFAYDGADPQGTGSDLATSNEPNYNKGEGTYDNAASPFARRPLKHIDNRGYHNIKEAGKISSVLNELTLKDFSKDEIDSEVQTGGNYGVSGVSYTINAPVEGYYDLTLSYSTNPALAECSKTETEKIKYNLVVFVNDGVGNERYVIPFTPLAQLSNGKADVSVYLKKGLNTLAISSPMDSNFINRMITTETVNNKQEYEFFDIGALRVSSGIKFLENQTGDDPRS